MPDETPRFADSTPTAADIAALRAAAAQAAADAAAARLAAAEAALAAAEAAAQTATTTPLDGWARVVADGYAFAGHALPLGALVVDGEAAPTAQVRLPPSV